MEKLTEIKEKLAIRFAENNKATLNGDLNEDGINNVISDFIYGFDAAMELQLPVKFAVWVDEWDNWKNLSEDLGIDGLYKYWITNIYIPETKVNG